MGWLRIFGAIGVVAAQVASAAAADLPNIVPPPPKPVIWEFGQSGWYLRGDIGYDWGWVGGAESTAPFSGPTDNSLGNDWSGDVGVGYKGKWVRTDVTVGYLAPLKYQGTVATAGRRQRQNLGAQRPVQRLHRSWHLVRRDAVHRRRRRRRLYARIRLCQCGGAAVHRRRSQSMATRLGRNGRPRLRDIASSHDRYRLPLSRLRQRQDRRRCARRHDLQGRQRARSACRTALEFSDRPTEY